MFKPRTFEEKFFCLVAQIIRIVRKETAYPIESHEPSMLQLQAMMLISAKKITMSDIADELSVKLPTATSLINRLVKSDYVKRVMDKKDRRVTEISLTKKGNRTLSNVMKIKMKRMKFILDKFSNKDKKLIFTVLQNLYKSLV